ncbi:uncharacterized protein UTRI_02023_B [Ustilago trichophora]|uniref:Transcription elongation factor Eaf N-terminal domain-containing protein n=1 Tax=Ustilago trichophora TaxID=86804 RepID=A0A5C3DUX0_9BASI|nr:uncharacterized protein UTRI_02023_B [Ustilago trichophora]
MSRDRIRRFQEVTVGPSASALLEAVSHAGSHGDVHDTLRHEEVFTNRQPLPNYFALNFNFKPDSTHDCKRGALFQPGPSRNTNADWQLELESHEADQEAVSGSAMDETAKKKPAHIFTGPQTAAKAYDLVLVWDEAAQVYRLDRIASAFSFKYERSKTVLSNQSQDVWTKETAKSKKRSIQDGPLARSDISASGSVRPGEAQSSAALLERNQTSQGAERSSRPSSSSKSGDLKLRGKTSTAMTPVRRSSRRSIAVEMEEFDDGPETLVEPSTSSSTDHVKRSSMPQEEDPPTRQESKKAKVAAPPEKSASPSEPAGGLRRSRRRSSQAQVEEASSPPHRRRSSETSEPAIVEKVEEPQTLEGDDDDLALELERELEREIEIEMEDASEAEEQAAPAPISSSLVAKRSTDRSISPVSRLKHAERQMKVNTPKAHTPDLDDVPVPRSSSLSKSFKRTTSPSTDRSAPADDTRAPPSQPTASIGLGLQQTGVGITPTASPHLDVASPTPASVKSPRDLVSPTEPSKSSGKLEDAVHDGGDEDEDDDLDDFAAELDMSLAEAPEAPPVAPPAAVEKRRSSRAYTAAQSAANTRADSYAPRQIRKAYGLGGPRQEEEELEDSD